MRLRRNQYIIYAVTLREHPDIVKIGGTTNWRNRRQEYDYWNFAGILNSTVFCITEEYANLIDIERACINGLAMKIPLFRGCEWFKGSILDATEVIEDVLNKAGLSFSIYQKENK